MVSPWLVVAGSTEVPAIAELTPDELAVFDRDLVRLAGYFGLSRDLSSLFLADRDVYLVGATIAKKELNAGFGGVVPGSTQFGMGFIRSKTILGTTSWLRTITSAGWNDIFGSSAAPIDLSTTSTIYGNPQNRVSLMFPKLIDYAIPKINEIRLWINPTEYPIWVTKFMQITDLYVCNLPAAAYISVNNKFYMRGNVEGANVTIGTAPLGLMFAKQSYMTGSGQE